MTFFIKGVDNHDTERRRQIALKALKDRLSKTETQSVSETNNWPSLDDDISTSNSIENTSEIKTGGDNDEIAPCSGDISQDVQIDIDSQKEVLEVDIDDKKPLLSPEN